MVILIGVWHRVSRFKNENKKIYKTTGLNEHNCYQFFSMFKQFLTIFDDFSNWSMARYHLKCFFKNSTSAKRKSLFFFRFTEEGTLKLCCTYLFFSVKLFFSKYRNFRIQCDKYTEIKQWARKFKKVQAKKLVK